MSIRLIRFLMVLPLTLTTFVSIESSFAVVSYSFTNAGATGRNGPTQAQINTAYTSTTLAGSITITTQGIQEWVVPSTGNYEIIAVGAGGGGAAGGRGASMTGTFSLTSGQRIKILVGQTSVRVLDSISRERFGGGGGSFVVTSSNVPLIVAGGGGGISINGGSFVSANAGDASTNPSPGYTTGGASGTGSSGCGGQGQGGAGFNTDGSGSGTDSNGNIVQPAKSFLNGGVGGTGGSDQCPGTIGGTPYGAFGGGGGGANGGGGGGGYFGGTGGDNISSGSNYDPGDGGGSYNSGTNQSNVLANNRNTNGSVTINSTAAPDTTAPTFTSSSSFSTAENIATSATAATIRVSESATVTISSGADAARFNISRSDTDTAIIKFNVSPNYEAPIDVGGNNVYELTLTATDTAANAGTQSITITVTDVVDTSSFNSLALAGSVTTATYRTVVVITANVSVASKITFTINGQVLPGCKNRSTSGSGSSHSATCTWKPSRRGSLTLSASATPTGAGITGATATPVNITVGNRTSTR